MQDIKGYVGEGRTFPDHFFIGGNWVKPSSDSKLQMVCPATEVPYLRVAEADAQDVEAAVAAARGAFDHGPWPRLSADDRAAFLRRIGEAVGARSGDFADLWSREVGAVNALARMVVPMMADAFGYYATLADRFPFEERHEASFPGTTGLLVREPVGVVAAVVPWNAPLPIIAYKIAPALLAGCTVVLKASPEAPAAAFLLAEILESLDLPGGVVNVITADREVSELLIRHPGVDKVSFTGSTTAGRRIGAICGERMARFTLELGGKSAALILDDYDIDTAARTLAQGAVALTGQVCSSLTRIVIARHRQAALAEALAGHFAATKVGDPFDPETQMGPLATARQRDRVLSYIETGRSQGAALITGGGRPAHLDKGFYVAPTLFSNVDNSSRIAQEEIFGPVLSVIAADDEDQAVAIANDSAFGLNAAIFTNDADRAYRVARRIRSGTVGHNGAFTELHIAAGGMKQSGVGREGGVDGLLAFTEAKTIVLDAQYRG